jgi:hypothetical protein
VVWGVDDKNREILWSWRRYSGFYGVAFFTSCVGLWGSIFLGVMGSMGVMGLILSIGLLWLFGGNSPVLAFTYYARVLHKEEGREGEDGCIYWGFGVRRAD